MTWKYLQLSCLGLVFGIAMALPQSGVSKFQTIPTSSAIPGELRLVAEGFRIYLESARTLSWPNQGPLLLQGPGGLLLAKVDLLEKITRENGAEAMGLSVEETDLGGALSAKKKYLTGKQAPTGRKLDAASLAETPDRAGAGQATRLVIQGIPITTTTYPNGSNFWKIEWPDFVEELFFDKKKSLVSDQQTRQLGRFTVILKQFADGSFQRQYRQAAGTFEYTYDAGDQSYRLVFGNAKGETVAELSCQENCSAE